MNNFQAADLLYFSKYIFTDTNTSASHFALVLLPPSIMNYSSNLLCSVITSKKETYCALKLAKADYKCFSKDSYICFKRRDIENLNDLGKGSQPVSRLNTVDIKKAFKIIKLVYYGTGDIYQMGTVIREWKKIM